MARSPKPGHPVDPARLAAFRVLEAVYERQAYANLSSIHLLQDDQLDARDRAFASAIIYGTISRTESLRWLLGQVSSRPLAQIDPIIRTILLMGAWQIICSETIPDAAAVNESVRLVRHLSHGGAAGFVNAVLRRLSRERPELPLNRPHVRYSLSAELYGSLKKWYPDSHEALAASFLREQPSLAVRVNTRRADPRTLAADLAAQGMTCHPGIWCPEALHLELAGHSIRSLPQWQDGLLTVQDEAAMLVGHVVSPRPGERLIDLCAAPGGKTSHLCELSGGRADVAAFDLQPHRLELLREHLQRLGHDSVDIRQGDATGNGMDPALAATADRVLLDAPCSGLGLLARRPELRLTMTYERMQQLYPMQREMLDYAATLVRPGGWLIYSTCTINPLENIEAVRRFLVRHDGQFKLTALPDPVCDMIHAYPDLVKQAAEGWLQILPDRHPADGFFIARLQRVSQEANHETTDH